MLTPAMSASRTSLPSVISANAVSTHVLAPPFLYLLPFDEEMTAGFTLLRIIMVGARSSPGAAAASPAAVPAFTNSRRLIRRGIGTSVRVRLKPAQGRHDRSVIAGVRLQADPIVDLDRVLGAR